MSKNKPKWGKPKLIVLIRGKQEEMVLAGCKLSGVSGDPGTGTYSTCRAFQLTGGGGRWGRGWNCLGYCYSIQSS
ncbi:MAG: hypothetical protein KKH08_03225 [Candidatus Omnitrophica bacterium]|nr:hypothetical protein [Candidatus Omnitrophota bacterium]